MTRKGTAKLTELLQIEEQMQKKWDTENMFEMDAAAAGTDESKYVQRELLDISCQAPDKT